MAKVIPGRYTAQTEEPFVVFLIGMRINKFFAFRKWVPVARAMGPMLRTLYQHPEKGFLGGEFYFNLRGPVLIQYWRSFEDLEKFARDKSDLHLNASNEKLRNRWCLGRPHAGLEAWSKAGIPQPQYGSI